jgi:TRAP-type C4-dicarboxylate transport system permease small subunit
MVRRRYDVAKEGFLVNGNKQKSTESVRTGTLLRVKIFIDRLSMVIGVIAGIILCIMLAIIITDVSGRYGFNKPLTGAMELAEGSLVFIAALSLMYTQNQKGHLIVTVLTERISHRWQITLNIIGLILGFGIVSILAWQNLLFAMHSYAIREASWSTLPIPLYPLKFGLFAGYVLLCIHYVLDLFTVWRVSKEEVSLLREGGF